MKIRFVLKIILDFVPDLMINLQVTPSKETMMAWQNRPQKLVASYIKHCLANSGELPIPKPEVNAVTPSILEADFTSLIFRLIRRDGCQGALMMRTTCARFPASGLTALTWLKLNFVEYI